MTVILSGFRGRYGHSSVFADGDAFAVLVDGDQRYTLPTLKQAQELARKRAFVAPQVAT